MISNFQISALLISNFLISALLISNFLTHLSKKTFFNLGLAEEAEARQASQSADKEDEGEDEVNDEGQEGEEQDEGEVEEKKVEEDVETLEEVKEEVKEEVNEEVKEEVKEEVVVDQNHPEVQLEDFTELAGIRPSDRRKHLALLGSFAIREIRDLKIDDAANVDGAVLICMNKKSFLKCGNCNNRLKLILVTCEQFCVAKRCPICYKMDLQSTSHVVAFIAVAQGTL